MKLTFLLHVFCLLVFLQPANAKENHIQSAFVFEKKKEWNEAIAHAKLANNAVLSKYFTWEYLKDPESDASFAEITEFLRKNPHWPDKNALEKRAEVALMAENPSDEMLDDWFSQHPPQTTFVRQKLAENQQERNTMIRSAWISDNYDKKTEERVLNKYRTILKESDHIQRIDRLLWESKNEEAKRLLPYVSEDYQILFQARLALNEERTFAPVQVLRVSSKLKSDPGLLFERIRWRLKNNDKEGVRELLLSSGDEVPYPEKWWYIRDRQIREAIDEGDITMAENLLAKHGLPPGSTPYKEAKWLAGWLMLRFQNTPDKAYRIFTELFEQNESPAGKAKAAYWAGRAAEKLPKTDHARWYGEAAYYSTTFYGQLADWELKKRDKDRHSHVIIPSDKPTNEEKARFKHNELVQLVYELYKAGESDAAARFINHIATNAKTDGEAVLATGLGRDIKRIDYGVRAAKKVLQNEIVSLENGWPVINVPTTSGLEKPLILALIRQESEFYAEATSSSNAMGLMQLLPSTAKETAKKNKIKFSKDKLFEPSYNITLGSAYISKLVDRFDGSYILSIASYNAGPGRVRQWQDSFGTPNKDVREAIDWIERIPYNETRNYVQHVLENVQVYRYLLAGKKPSTVMISEDLIR